MSVGTARGTAWWASVWNFFERQTQNDKIIITLALFAPLVVLRLVLLAGMRIPMGHDTLEYLEMQYTLFNEAALRGSLPQWMPFMTQGTLSNIWVISAEGIFSLVVTPFAPLLRGVNFLYLFEAGLLFDEFVLLLGCVLLASRYFKSRATVVFVCAAITYTSISSVQVWFDFHLFYLVPLILYCFDRSLRDGSLGHLFAAGLLSVTTLLGSLPYFAPPLAFGIMVFGITLLVSAPRETGRIIRHFLQKFSWRHIFALLIPAILAGLIFLYYQQWQAALFQANLGRGPTGLTSSIGVYLTYAGYTDPTKFLELFGRYTNNLDNVIYSGLLVIPFALVSIFRVRSRISYAFGMTALVLASLTIGSNVAVILYYFFPLGNAVREIGLLVPAMKPFLVFYAGFGFDAFWLAANKRKSTPWNHTNRVDRATLLLPLATMGIATLLTILTILKVLLVFNYPPWVIFTQNQLFLSPDQIYVALAVLLVLDIIYFALFVGLTFTRKWVTVLLLLVLAVSTIDTFSFKTELDYAEVPQVSQGVVGLFNTYNYNFSMERSQNYYSNSRFTAIAPYILGGSGPDKLPDNGSQPYPATGRYGALYWNTESFLYFDAEASVFRTDSMMRSEYQFYRAFVAPSQDVPIHLGFPIPNSTAYMKLTGFQYPKLQLFSSINILPSDAAINRTISSPNFSGDMIFANATDGTWSKIKGPVVWQSANFSDFSNERINGTIKVKAFSFDSLRIEVDSRSNKSAVLYYADAWYPDWHAAVNGVSTPVIRTNLGYKSIIIPPGDSTIVFSFNDWKDFVVLQGIEALGIIAFCVVLYLFAVDAIGIDFLSFRRVEK